MSHKEQMLTQAAIELLESLTESQAMALNYILHDHVIEYCDGDKCNCFRPMQQGGHYYGTTMVMDNKCIVCGREQSNE